MRFYLGDMPWETTGETGSATTSILVADGEDWAVGDIGEFVSDGDTFRVREVSGADLAATRSYYGSTGASHTSGRIFKNPKYKYNEITNAISTVIQAYLPWPRIYKVTADTITPAPTTTTWYDLASDALGLVSVYQISDNSPIQRQLYGEHHKYNRVGFEMNMPTTLVSSGVGVKFPDGFLDADNTVYINYAAKITDTVTSSSYDDFSDGEAVVEAIILGTVGLLQRTLEARKERNSSNEPDYIRSGRDFNSMFQSALRSAEKEIRAKTPLMRTG